MEFERPHRSGNSSGSELFICFTSRPSFSSSSSMKISSKPIQSPGRSDKYREPTLSFSSSLNRRLGSMKGGQSSPMFKKRGGCGFENAEPTSPKVTCIGQVRVKTKKQGKKMMGFGKPQGGILQENKKDQFSPQRNQKWVHLPLTICEALRGFGAEFNCFLPCGRSSCASRGRGEEKRRTVSSCGAVFAKWLMALQEGEEEKGREIRVIVAEEEKRDIEIEEQKRNEKEETIGEYEENFSICIPPKNALLLMRCRSEPLRMSALANRFWESPIQDEDEDSDEENKKEEEIEKHERNKLYAHWGLNEVEEDENSVKEEKSLKEQKGLPEIAEDNKEVEEHERNGSNVVPEEDENFVNQENPLKERRGSADIYEDDGNSVREETQLKEEQLFSAVAVEEDEETEQWGLAEFFEVHENEDESLKEEPGSAEVIKHCENSVKGENQLEEQWGLAELFSEEQQITVTEELKEEDGQQQVLDLKLETIATNDSTFGSLQVMEILKAEETEQEKNFNRLEEEKENRVLPDCLLMMMCEPKLSMEVSKETWVCSKDFIPRRSQNQVLQTNGGDDRDTDICKPAQQQNQLYTVSHPAPSMTTMIEQKLMNAVAYEPFVLTRCKSEPLRSSALLVPEACFWKNRQLEPHGVGF